MDDAAKTLEALEWAWTNIQGRMPDKNTMSETEIAEYWMTYESKVRHAIVNITGKEPQ